MKKPRRTATMWDTVQDTDHQLSHDLPCQRCGHAAHTYLACDAVCECRSAGMPGAIAKSA